MHRFKKRLIISVLIASMGLVTGCQSGKTSSPTAEDSDSGKLKILKSDAEVNQESRLSQIKADLLKENQGYLDTDEITAILELEGSALVDYFLDASDRYDSVASYAATEIGTLNAKAISLAQTRLIDKLTGQGLIKSVNHTYSTIVNAVAVTTTYGNFKEISDFAGIKNAILSETYNLPTAVSTDTEPVENVVDVYEDTGIFNSSTVSYNGEHTAVAILDSGFDCSHSVFAEQPENPLIDENYISSILTQTNASTTSANLKVSDVYYSKKIPFVYDYADKDSDVNPYDSEHGTHVAGIIGGHDDRITGVATHTQLVLLKVFPDLDDGAPTDAILAALEDAVLLKVDAINMSLGSACGFTREEDGNAINAIYDKIEQSGISLITAASNNYSSGYGSKNGNTSKVTNPDSATVGSPSTYAGALSVASISGTKSEYILANDDQIFFFNESNNLASKPYDFFDMLGIPATGKKTFEYVTVPGVGILANYSAIDVKGKIALVRRGENTFEEKAKIAYNKGAVGCIIYNNIAGDILMSMGKEISIPTISISKDDGTKLAARNSGTLTFDRANLAGPFMSDFSSWGPSPDLSLKPEITAHGGNITSSIPGGGYDKLSGTSMASPNMCGIIVLIRQYLKEKYPSYSHKQISVMANELLMSTATIALDTVGNPYSPRKQGAGLASLKNAVNTGAFITVDDKDRAKLELGDDPKRTGVYEMNFNVVNISESPLSYSLEVLGMTESVSSSDKDYVAEMDQILKGATDIQMVSGGTLDGSKITVAGGATAKIKVTYTLTAADKKIIDDSFPYGMYVEGFVKLHSADAVDGIDLNVPFLAFYGDWTEAPMFDKTYFEVESEAHDQSIDEDDKLKADYFATTPYGTYFYNYIIPLGTYIYDMDEDKYDAIPATEDHIAISTTLGSISGITAVYAGLLRNAKEMKFSITDVLSGEVVYSFTDYTAQKAHSYGADPVPYYEFLKISPYQMGLVNNKQYQFKMEGILDYGDGGVTTNARNSFTFNFYVDEEAPILKNATYEKVYDKTQKKDRYYINLTVSDNQYVQSVQPVIFTSSSSYTTLSDHPIPVYGSKGKDATVRVEITDYLDQLYSDTLITSSLAFIIDDYALNSNIFLCELPGTTGEFKFTNDGTMSGSTMPTLTVYTGETTDLVQYLATADETVDADKDYLKHLQWSSSNENVAVVKNGQISGLKPGRITVSVYEQLDLNKASLIVIVKDRPTSAIKNIRRAKTPVDNATAELEDVKFSYFDTLYAHKLAGQTSEIGQTGSRVYFTKSQNLTFYPGEKIQIHPEIYPWYLPTDRYELIWSSTNPEVASVDSNGIVTAHKKGKNVTIKLQVKIDGRISNIMATTKVSIESEFVIENRTLIAYKGVGGDVVIPDDEGILNIGSFAFCLYDTDNNMDVGDDIDANKTPGANTSITSVVIPEGVEDIQKYAFYNCTNLTSVTLPSSAKYVRQYAFYKNSKLESINLETISVIGERAFAGCSNLGNVDLSKIYAIGVRAFEGCKNMTAVNVSTLRNSGKEIFKDCTSLEDVTFSDETVLSYAMFVNTGIKNLKLGMKRIPDYCFANCVNLESVEITNDIISIGIGAFSGNTKLTDVVFDGSVDWIYDQAFYNCLLLQTLDLPNSKVKLGNYVFFKCEKLSSIGFGEKTEIEEIGGSTFDSTALADFIVAVNSEHYKSEPKSGYLTSKDGTIIVLAAPKHDFGDLIIPENILKISDGAFSGITSLHSLTVANPAIIIGNYAFANCTGLNKVTFPTAAGTLTIGKHAFNSTKNLTEVINLNKITAIGDYAFANSGLRSAILSDHAVIGEGAFFKSALTEVTLGTETVLGMGAFQSCLSLKTVNMPAAGGVEIGASCFSNDTALTVIDLSKTTETIAREAFFNCTSLKIADLGAVKYVGDYAFADCASLSTVNMPIVVTIGEGAFSRNSENGRGPVFAQLTLPSTLKTIGTGAFIGCEYLKSIVIPTSVESIGSMAFAYCLSLATVSLPNTIKEILEYTFAGCSALTSINVDSIESIAAYGFASTPLLSTVNLNKVVSIGEAAFASSGLTSIGQAERLETVGDYAFQGTKFTTFAAPVLKSIGEGAFSETTLESFTFSSKLEKLGLMAFYNSSKLAEFNYLSGNVKKTDGQISDYAFLENGALYTYMPSGKLLFHAYPAALNNATLTVKEGTYRIDTFAGNQNPYVTAIVLPDSLRSIGNHAFRGCSALESVEFKSFSAPTLESNYQKDEKLAEGDPGYELLHKYVDMFGLEVYYAQFIDLVGRKQPIKMILPANEDAEGYDSIIYQAFFGKVETAGRSSYVARDNLTVAFLEAVEKLPRDGSSVTLKDEPAVMAALTAYNSLKQDLTTVGFTAAEFAEFVKRIDDANAKIKSLKLAAADPEVRAIQEVLDKLNTEFKAEDFDTLQNLTARISALTNTDKSLLDLTNYNKVLASYTAYLNALESEIAQVETVVSHAYAYAALSAAVGMIGLLSLVAVISRRKFF